MYNRYQGNSGRVARVPDAPQPSIRPHPPAPPAGNNKPPGPGAPRRGETEGGEKLKNKPPQTEKGEGGGVL